MTILYDNAFSYCSSVEELELPDGMTSVCNLWGLTSLKHITIPKSVDSIIGLVWDDYEGDQPINSEDLVIYCYADTYGEQFAKDNNIPYVIIDDDMIKTISGDVDVDGELTSNDALTILRMSTQSPDELSEEMKAAADYNGDGIVNSADALFVLRASIGLSN